MRRGLQTAESPTDSLRSESAEAKRSSDDRSIAPAQSPLITSALCHRIRVSSDARYLTIGQVRERFGVSDMWVWRYMRQHDFPKPVQFGGPTSARHWLISDVEQWERERAIRSKRSRADTTL